MSDLTALETAGGLSITTTPLRTLALPALRTVDGDVDLIDLPALEALSFPLLASLRRLTIEAAPALTTVAGPNVASPSAGVQLVDLPSLETLDADFGEAVDGGVTLDGLPRLRSLEAFAGVRRIDRSLQLESVGVTTLDGLQALAVLGGALVLEDLVDLDSDVGAGDVGTVGLSGLQAVPVSVTIRRTGLVSLRSFGVLARVGGSLIVAENERLATVDDVKHLIVGGNVEIRANPRLDACAAERLAIQVGGTIDDVDDNGGDGCYCAP